VISDVPKTLVYDLAAREPEREVIPRSSSPRRRAPSSGRTRPTRTPCRRTRRSIA
jgi:hypothetical protein